MSATRCDLVSRARLATEARQVSRESERGGGPMLTEASTREEVCAWLQWCDPNGCHTDERAEAEDFDPYTVETAWEAVRDMLNSA